MVVRPEHDMAVPLGEQYVSAVRVIQESSWIWIESSEEAGERVRVKVVGIVARG